jgi:hypothetical protein
MTFVGTQGPSKLAPLPYGITGDTSDLRHFAVEQRDGSYLLFLWRTASVWNRDTKQPIAVPSKRLSLYLPTANYAAVRHPLSGTAMFPMGLDAATHRTPARHRRHPVGPSRPHHLAFPPRARLVSNQRPLAYGVGPCCYCVASPR